MFGAYHVCVCVCCFCFRCVLVVDVSCVCARVYHVCVLVLDVSCVCVCVRVCVFVYRFDFPPCSVLFFCFASVFVHRYESMFWYLFSSVFIAWPLAS